MLGAGAAVAGFAVISVNAALDAQEANLKLQNTFQNNAKLSDSSVEAFQRQADALRELTGVDDEAIITAQALLGQFKLTGEQVQELTPLVVDLSSKMGIDLQSAAKAVGKATQGSTGILSRYGIILDEAAVETDAFSAVTEGLSGTVGGFAKQLADEQPWRVFISEIEEVAEQFGKALVPILQSGTRLLRGLIPILETAANNMGLIVGALAGFAAVRFVPPLLFQMALGLEAIGAAGVANGVLNVATAMSTLGKAIPLVALASVPVLAYEIVGALAPVSQEQEILNERMKEFGVVRGPGMQRGLQAVSEDLEAMRAKAGMAAQGLETMAGNAEGLEEAADEAAGATRHLTDAMIENRLQALAASNAFLAIELSARDLAEAQRELNRLERQGKEDTKAYEDAVLDALTAQIGLEEAVFAYGKELADSGKSQADVTDKIRAMGRELGISRANLDDLINRIRDYINEIENIPEQTTTRITTVFTQEGRPVGGFTGPQAQHGGIVTRTGLAMIHKGEVFSGVNNEMGFGNQVNVTVNGWVGNDQELARKIRDELNKLGGRNAGTGLN